MAEHKIYMATVALEPNRWGSKESSFPVSEWMDRFDEDGFDGVEIWDNHYLKASADEQSRLAEKAPIAVFNSYVGFDDASAKARQQTAQAITKCGSWGIKYNFGYNTDLVEEYTRNLLEWEKSLPPHCVLLCECHQGTPLETVEAAKAVFDQLDPERFALIVHLAMDGSRDWFEAFGKRIKHVHIQLRDDVSDPSKPEGREALRTSIARTLENGFEGSFSLEFTRGIGKDEKIEELYANASSDLREIKAALKSIVK